MTDATKSSREPSDSRYTQQQLKAYRPVLRPSQVIVAYLSISIVAIPLGTVCLHAANSVDEVIVRYDNQCDGFDNDSTLTHSDILQQEGSNVTCHMMIDLTAKLKAPVYVYYELENYYQNHRRYVKSRSDDQLAGKQGGGGEDCKPKLYQRNPETLELDTSLPVNPCGLIAWSFFNDSIQIDRSGAESIKLKDKGIAWESDVQYAFGDHNVENFNDEAALRGGGTIEGSLSDNEHFIVWMRPASLPSFRKLYSVVETDLDTDKSLLITIQNRYNTYLFGGKKSIVLSTTSWLGGKNPFLGIVFISLGIISFGVGCMYFAFHLRFPRDFADVRFLSWKRGG